ncbi:MFS transporter [Streptomyces sp. NPDC001709]
MRKWWPLVAVCLGSFMLLVDVTIVTVALPDMAHSLKASFAGMQWALNIYALALAMLLIGAGSLADRVGHRKLYVAGLALFALASLACGLAPDAGFLIVARGVQGVGGAAMFVTTLALIATAYEGRARGLAIGIWAAVGGAAAAVGPMLGGLLTEYLDWRAIFFVNLPVSAVGIALTLLVVGEPERPGSKRLDVMGTATFGVCAGALTFGLNRADADGWTSSPALGLFALAAAALVAFVATERGRTNALIDLKLFRNVSFVSVMLGAVAMSAAFSCLVYTSVWLQGVLGLSPVRAGLALAPLAATAFVASTLAGRLLHDVTPRLTIGIGLLLIGLGCALQSVLGAHSTSTALIPGLIVTGVGVGITGMSLSAAALGAVSARQAGMAAGALNTFRQLGYALGAAVLGVVFRSGAEAKLRGRTADAHTAATAMSDGNAPHLRVFRAAAAHALVEVYCVAAALGVVAGLLALLFVRGSGPAPEPAAAPEPEPAVRG